MPKLEKLPKRKVTVKELLLSSDVAQALEKAAKRQGQYQEVIVLGVHNNGPLDIYFSSIRLDRIIFLLEWAKTVMMDELRQPNHE